MAQISNCLKIISKLDERDQDALVARLDEIQAQGVPAERAQIQAAIDVMAPLERAAAPVVRSARRDYNAEALGQFSAGGNVTLFHGTTPENADRLLREGKSGKAPLGANGGSRGLLYVTTDPENAAWYAGQSGSGEVLRVSVPASQLRIDPEDGVHDSVLEELQAALRTGVPASLAVYGDLPLGSIVRSAARSASDKEPSRSLSRPHFYSQLQRAIEQVPDRLASMAAPQWKLWLDANAPKLGVKKGEIEFSGVRDFLALAGSNKVDRNELAALAVKNSARTEGLSLYAEGATADSAASSIGVSQSTVLRWVKWAGIGRTGPETKGVTPEKRAEALKLYKAGDSIAVVAKKTGLGTSTVHRIVVVDGSNRSLSDVASAGEEAKSDAIALYILGLTTYEAAAEVGVHQGTVATWIQDAGVSRGYSGAQSLRSSLDRNENSHGIKGHFTSKKGGGRMFAASVYELARMHQLEADDGVSTFSRSQDRIPYGEGRNYNPDLEVVTTDGRVFVEEVKPMTRLSDKDVREKAIAAMDYYRDSDKAYRIITERTIGQSGFDAIGPGDYPAEDASRVKSALSTARWFAREAGTEPAWDLEAPVFSRTRGWAGFPDAIIATPPSTQSKDASYEAAKAGDMKAALELVDRVLPADIEEKIRAAIGDSKPIVAAVHAEEAAGRNKIPLATAFVIGERMGLQVDDKLAQASRAKRTGSSGMARLGVQPEFAGAVEEGADYLLVDDTLAQGGTLAQLKTHIEDNGGRVVGVFALSGKQYSAKLSLDKSTLSDVRAKYESIEDWWTDELGFDFAGLTESEARYMLKSGLSPDALRDQVTAARQAAGIGAGQEDSAQLSRGRNPQVDTPEFKKWFGDSKVVDAEGAPKTLYHGTRSDFRSFSKKGVKANFNSPQKHLGFFFADSAAYSDRYTSYYGAGEYFKDGANTMPVYLSLKNPKIEPIAKIDEIEDRMSQEDAKAYRLDLESQGFDGVIFEGDTRIGFVREYVAFDSKQIKSSIGNSGTFNLRNPDITQSKGRTASGADWESPSASKFDDLVYKFQDKQIETKRVVEAIKEASGSLRDDLNVYLNEEMYHGRAAKRTEDFVNMELDPLIRDMAKAGMKIADLEEFLHARHAKEANAVIAQRNPGEPAFQDGGSGMTNAEADNYMATLPAADRATLEAAAGKVDAIIAGTRKMFVDYELESQSAVDAWNKMFKHYVPLQREDKEGSPGLGQGFSIKGRETKGRTGSTRKVVDILANIAMQRERAIVRGEKNRVAQSLVGLVKANENPDFWLVDEVPTERVFNPATGLVEDRVDPMYKSRDNAVVAKIKDPSGAVREHAVLFNEEDPRALRMAQALKNLDAQQLNGLLGVSAKITRYFAAVNTQYNPVFGVVNLVRDVQGAMLNLTSTPLKDDKAKIARYTASALTGIYGDMRAARKGQNQTSKWAALWDEFQEVGGQTGYRDLFATSADRAEAIQNSLDPSAWMDSKLGKVFTAGGALKVPLAVAQKQAGFIFDWLSDYNGAMENGVRLAAYKAGLERGLSKQQAASIAKNLTTNFNRKGQTAQQAGAMYAFFNAAIQGTARIGQTLFDMEPGKPKTLRLSSAGKKIVYGGILLGSIQAMALAAAGFGEEDPPEFARERSLIIPTGNKTYVSIPMPLGMHIIPNIGRVATEFALSGFKDPIKRSIGMAAMFADAFNPIGNAGMSMQTLAPTALDPLVALTENRDWTGRPISKTSFNKATPGHALGRDTATAVSEVLSEAINTLSGGNKYVAGVFSPTPDAIDYIWGQVTGGVGREYSKTEQTIKSIIRGESLPTYKIPLVGRFVGNAKGQASEGSAFYANVDRLNEIETEVKGLKSDGKETEARKILAENPEAYLITAANYAERQAQKLRKQKSELVKAGAPREQVKSIEEQITQVMARFNRASEELRERATAAE